MTGNTLTSDIDGHAIRGNDFVTLLEVTEGLLRDFPQDEQELISSSVGNKVSANIPTPSILNSSSLTQQ